MSALAQVARASARPALALAVVTLLLAATARFADLRPTVDRAFFFSTESRTLEQAARIEQLFELHAQLVVIARAPDIGTERYRHRIERLSEALAGLDGVIGVRSLADGPDDLEDARNSPLWSRLLLAEDASATHVLLLVRDPWPESLVPGVEALLARHEQPDFALAVAGVPHTVAVMQRQLVRDFAVFGTIAVAAFGLVSLALFRSLRVAVGVVASCAAAVALTFLALQWSGASLGLLSANLVTIVFVLTQSHLVFLTSNWRRVAAEGPAQGAVLRAMRETLRPSLGSAATTLLGFGTLLFVEAKPLRELGLGGVVGGAAAFAAAFLLHPLFLPGTPRAGARASGPGALERLLTARHPRWAAALAAACACAGLGLARLDTDPSLLAYFDEEGEIHEALAHLDRHTGSAPLELVLRRADGRELLDGDGAYEALWEVQSALEREPTVGRIVSLPVVLAEGERAPLGSLLPKRWMLRLLESPLFDRVAGSFVSPDRTHALFAIQMIEHERERSRVEVIERLRAVVAESGFEAPLVGGVYHLHGRLAQLVAHSMAQSLAALAVLFTAVAWVTTGSLGVALAMSAVLALVPLAVFGGMGLAGVPVDVVTAPAASIGLGLAADALLHLAVAASRGGRQGGALRFEAWSRALASQWRGILRISLLVAMGFGLFAFSGFPPTRRFGLAVAAAALVAAPLALAVLPALTSGAARLRRAL